MKTLHKIYHNDAIFMSLTWAAIALFVLFAAHR